MNGPLLPLAAVAAGVLSASSPCVLPVIPGYLAAVSSNTHSEDGDAHTSITGAAGFVAGFTVVFTLLGATASAFGNLLYHKLTILLPLAGVVLIALGAHTLGIVRLGFVLHQHSLVDISGVGLGPRRSVLLGMVFALGWTPCIGPILATILTKAAADASLTQGMLLLLLYSAGLGMPFLAIAVWFDRSHRLRRTLSRNARRLQRIGGLAMVIVGTGYVTGFWSTLFGGAQRLLAKTGWPPL